MANLWADEGPISQGKILTAILQNREDDARQMLSGWSSPDLRVLARASLRLDHLATRERQSR